MTLKEHRESAGLLQVEVARKLGVEQSAISYWENGKTRIAKKHRKKLAKLYGCSVEDLISAQQERV